MKVTCVLFALLATVSPVGAEDLPTFDARVFCAAYGGRGQAKAAACIEAEKAAMGSIGARWAEYPKQRKHFCVQSVSFRRKDQQSYVTLAGCLDDQKTS